MKYESLDEKRQLYHIRDMNFEVLRMYSDYLNQCPRFIRADMIDEIAGDGYVPKEDAFLFLFQAVFQIEPESDPYHREITERYLRPSIRLLDCKDYENNPYYKNIHIEPVRCGQWEFKREKYTPYEAFIFDDIIVKEDYVEIPRLGFFDREFSFPAVLQNGREWMFITPNEINTMQPIIEEVKGQVVTFGLGMGYFAYMVSEKEDVDGITIVERDQTVIDLFEQYILPQFPHARKVHVVKEDAFDFVDTECFPFDYAFVDLWHDASDGVDLYKKMKKYEKRHSDTIFRYWIEKTLKSYIRWSQFN